ncbi:NADH-ubiquinone oxidoreductase 20.9 kDa subunit [Cucumis melo var. makuwa]|uniref:NADH-ubiquinone oxidoreductase 20.9 kDa subunit n=1 Tax=Cucumis melo var. makuwa TaxID=1194695 RepID=A0A5A7SYI3_CUCMM|nr:NADH-ubiquinone oxidoreductase 20.9 kDa subunit [Cucumis melo var. makuwa]TYK30875.1 NADH-ubiquinone oxidoreductase 20.9 kDa subunit [Cucumis melo var. makuwa]
MNTDITASTKPEYPVIDRNPPFTKVVGNFDTLDYLRFVTITGVSVTVGYLSGIISFFLSFFFFFFYLPFCCTIWKISSPVSAF